VVPVSPHLIKAAGEEGEKKNLIVHRLSDLPPQSLRLAPPTPGRKKRYQAFRCRLVCEFLFFEQKRGYHHRRRGAGEKKKLKKRNRNMNFDISFFLFGF
jgi:hypothetical protein